MFCDLSFDKNYFNGKMGVIKSGVKRFWFIFEENKTIEVENTNGKTFVTK
jgi:hypothetical protein